MKRHSDRGTEPSSWIVGNRTLGQHLGDPVTSRRLAEIPRPPGMMDGAVVAIARIDRLAACCLRRTVRLFRPKGPVIGNRVLVLKNDQQANRGL